MLFQDLKKLFFFSITFLVFRPRGLALSLFFGYYCPQTKFAKDMFLYVSVYPRGRGHVWQGGVRRREACVAGGMCGRGCTWQGACVAGAGCVHGGGHAWHGGMHGREGHGAWQEGERGHVWQGAYMARAAYMAGACMAGACVVEWAYVADWDMHGRGVCMAGGMHVHPPGRYHEIRLMSGRYSSYWNAFLFH